jgi:electron transport complex protein RnfG
MLLIVRGIEINTADEIKRSLNNHKRTLVSDILRNMDYDALLNVQLTPQLPINVSKTVVLSSIDAILIDRQTTAVLIELVTNRGYNGTIRLLVAVSANGVVLGARVIEHHETPGLGDKIQLNRSAWINSFIDKSLRELPSNGWRVRRDGGEFDQFTGATITPRAVVETIHQALLFVRDHHQALFEVSTSHTEVMSP